MKRYLVTVVSYDGSDMVTETVLASSPFQAVQSALDWVREESPHDMWRVAHVELDHSEEAIDIVDKALHQAKAEAMSRRGR